MPIFKRNKIFCTVSYTRHTWALPPPPISPMGESWKSAKSSEEVVKWKGRKGEEEGRRRKRGEKRREEEGGKGD